MQERVARSPTAGGLKAALLRLVGTPRVGAAAEVPPPEPSETAAAGGPLSIDQARRIIKNDWIESPYYKLVDTPADPVFWGGAYPFQRMFERLDLTRVVELACGHGRHAARILDRVGHITLVDINDSNIEACRRRFGGRGNVEFAVCSGSDLVFLASGSCTALFCYDAMVHFELHDIIAYLSEFRRVLATGGKAVLHYSNYSGNPGGLYHDNPHWRNFCSEPLFRHLAMRAGFTVLDSHLVDWGDCPALDAVSLIQKL